MPVRRSSGAARNEGGNFEADSRSIFRHEADYNTSKNETAGEIDSRRLWF